MSRVEYFGQPKDPATQLCDWCDRTATHAFEIHRPRKKIGIAQYLYSCPRHELLAQRASRAPRAAA